MNDAKNGLEQSSIGLPEIVSEMYNLDHIRTDSSMRLELEVKAGDDTRNIKRTIGKGISRQPQQPQGSIYNLGGQGDQEGKGGPSDDNSKRPKFSEKGKGFADFIKKVAEKVPKDD